jgi:hypothetical protein
VSSTFPSSEAIWSGFYDEMDKLAWPWGGGGITPPSVPKAGFGKTMLRHLKPTGIGTALGMVLAPMQIKGRAMQMMHPGQGFGA